MCFENCSLLNLTPYEKSWWANYSQDEKLWNEKVGKCKIVLKKLQNHNTCWIQLWLTVKVNNLTAFFLKSENKNGFKESLYRQLTNMLIKKTWEMLENLPLKVHNPHNVII